MNPKRRLWRGTKTRVTGKYINADIGKCRDIVDRHGGIVLLKTIETDLKRDSAGRN